MLKSLLTLSTSLSLGLLTLQAQALPTTPYSVTEAPVGLSLEERRAAYAAQASNPLPVMAANLLPLGIGSFGQGDVLGGMLILTVDTLSLGMLGMGLFNFFIQNSWGTLIYFSYGVLSLLAGRSIGMFAPGFYAEHHNARLRQELGLDRDLNPLAPQNSQQSPLLFSYSTRF